MRYLEPNFRQKYSQFIFICAQDYLAYNYLFILFFQSLDRIPGWVVYIVFLCIYSKTCRIQHPCIPFHCVTNDVAFLPISRFSMFLQCAIRHPPYFSLSACQIKQDSLCMYVFLKICLQYYPLVNTSHSVTMLEVKVQCF